MDFFRPVRSTDPLVGRPKAKPAPTVIHREKITSLPPALKQSPNAEKERDLYNTAKPPVYSPSVIIEEAVVSSKNITYFEEPEPKRPASTPAPKYKEPAKKEAKEDFELGLEDDWLESLKSEGFLTEEEEIEDTPLKLGKNVPKKSKYSFLDNSSVLKSVRVEKRPLSSHTPTSNLAPTPIINTPKKHIQEREHRPSDKKSLPFWVTILITVILGVAAGVAVFVLVS